MFGKRLAHSGKIVAVADIGSASAAVALVAIHPGAPAEVLVAERATLTIEERSKEATIAAIGEHLVQAGQKVVKKYSAQTGKAPSVRQLYCIIRSPWSRSRTTDAYAKTSRDVIVTQAMIGSLATQALANETELDRASILGASVIRVELNGYPTGRPVGKRAHEMLVTALVSDCDRELRAEVQAGMQSLFPHLQPVYRSSMRALLSGLQEKSREESDYCVVDMTSEGTTLIVVRDGVIAEQHSVAEGVRSILKRVAPTGMAEETLALMRMLERDQCSTAACETLRVSLAKVEPELVRSFGEGMTACASKRRLSNKLLLVAQPEIAPWLSRFFSRIDFTQFTLTAQPFTVETLVPNDLAQCVTPAQGVSLDTGIAFSAALVNRELGGR